MELGSKIVSDICDSISGQNRGKKSPVCHAANSRPHFQILFTLIWTQDLNLILLIYDCF